MFVHTKYMSACGDAHETATYLTLQLQTAAIEFD